MNGGAAGSKTTLLDLDDGLLLKILDNIHEASQIIRLGAMNKRLNRLHFMVSLTATVMLLDCDSEDHLYSFLRDVSRKGGGLIRHLSVTLSYATNQAPRFPMYARLQWIKLFSTSLQSLSLASIGRIFILGAALFADLASCTNLVSLRLRLNGVWVSGAKLQQLLAACTTLKRLNVEGRFNQRDSLHLFSKSLEKLHLVAEQISDSDEVSLSLETPALTAMRIFLTIGKLHLISHSLEVLEMDCLRGPITIETPLSKLEYLSTARDSWSPKAVVQVLMSIPRGCLDILRVPFSGTVSSFFPSVRQLKQLIVILEWERHKVPNLDARVLPAWGVEVEEIVVVVKKRREMTDDFLFNSIQALHRSFPLVQKISVGDGEFLNNLDPWDYNPVEMWKALDRKFPVLIPDVLIADDVWAVALRSRCKRWIAQNFWENNLYPL